MRRFGEKSEYLLLLWKSLHLYSVNSNRESVKFPTSFRTWQSNNVKRLDDKKFHKLFIFSSYSYI